MEGLKMWLAGQCLVLLFLIGQIDAHALSNSHSHCEFDFLILLDTSGSIKDTRAQNWDDMLRFTSVLVTDINKKSPVGTDSRVAIFSYSNSVKPDITLPASMDLPDINNLISTNGIAYQGSITRMYLAVRSAKAHLDQNIRIVKGLQATQVLILFTDGIPYSSDAGDGENSGNVLVVLQELMDEEVHVIMIGIGANVDKDLIKAIGDYSDFGRGTEVKDFTALSDTFAQLVLEPLEINCGPTTTMAPPTLAPGPLFTDIIIVIDGSSLLAWTTSYQILTTLISTQLRPYINSGVWNVRVVTSMQAVSANAIGTLRRPIGGNNLLFQALNRAYNELLMLMNNGRYKMVLLIHSGVINYDSGQNLGPWDITLNPDYLNSIRYVVWYQLKYLIGADIYVLPLPSASVHGIEVLQRITTRVGPMLTTAVNVMNIISQNYPTYDSCQNLDLTFMIDVSGSSDVTQVMNNVKQVLTFLRNNVRQQTRVALVTFSDFANIWYDLEAGQIADDSTYNAMVTVINSLQKSPQPATNVAVGLYVASQLVYQNHGDRLNGTNHVILFSDAQANMQTMGVYGVSPALQYALSVVNSIIYFPTTGAMLGPYQQLPLPVSMNINNIGDVFQSQLSMYRNCPPPPPSNPCLNMVVVFDSSGSLEDNGRDGHRHVKDYVSSLITTYYTTYAARALNIGIVHYAHFAAKLVEYNNYASNYQSAVALVEAADHLAGRTNVDAALELGIQMVGNTPQEQYGIIFLTDGESNEGSMDGGAKVKQVLDNGHNMYGIFLTDTFADRHQVMRGHMNDEHELFVQNFFDLPNQVNVQWAMDRICPPVTN